MKHIVQILVITALLLTPAWAQISDIYYPEEYSGDSSETDFSFTFSIDSSADLVVTVYDEDGIPSVKTINSDYTVSATNNNYRTGPGGTVTFTTAPATGTTVVLSRSIAQTQTTPYATSSAIRPATIRSSLDRLTMMVQDLQEQIKRCLRIPVSDSGDDVNIPTSANRANRIQGYDANGTSELYTSFPESTATTFWASLMEGNADAGEARTDLEVAREFQVDVRDYGAIAGDGLDDHEAFERADAAAVVSGGWVFVPGGVYDFADAIAPACPRWRGTGRYRSILRAMANNSTGIMSFPDGMNPLEMEGLCFRSLNGGGVAIDGPYNHYITGRMVNCHVYAEFSIGLRGLLGDILVQNCWFGYSGTPGVAWTPIYTVANEAGSYSLLTTRFDTCIFRGAKTVAAVVLDYANTIDFGNCVFESCSVPAVDANGVANLTFRNCAFEAMSIPDPNCLVYGRYNAVTGQATYCTFEDCRFTNSGTPKWYALFYQASPGCMVNVIRPNGGLSSSYFSKNTSGQYDTANTGAGGLLMSYSGSLTGYSGLATNYEKTSSRQYQSDNFVFKLWSKTAGETQWWLGRVDDAQGDDDDYFAIGTGTTAGSNIKFRISKDGDPNIPSGRTYQINGQNILSMARSTVVDANTPSGATTKAMPIYDSAGSLIGYIPVYANKW